MASDEIRDDVLPQVNAREINLVDSDGKVRIKLFVDEDNDCHAAFRDETGTERLNIILTSDGTVNVGIKDANGDYRNTVYSRMNKT